MEEREEGTREERRRKRKAARAVQGLLKRLRKGCDQFESVDSWLVFVRTRVKSVADEFEDVLPEETVRTMRTADRLAEATLNAVRAACKVLTGELEKALIALSATAVGAGLLGGGLAPTLVGGGVILAGLGVAAVVLGVFLTRATINLENRGCPPIEFPEELGRLEVVPGLEFPEEVDTDEEGVISFPAVNTWLEADPGQLELSIMGNSVTLSLSPEVEDIELDDQGLFGSGEREITAGEHEMVLICP